MNLNEINVRLLRDLYYLWSQYIKSFCINRIGLKSENNSQRNLNTFIKLLELFIKTNDMVNKQYNGQTKAEYQKNFKRVSDIVSKSAGDDDKAIRLSQTQAHLIKDEWKAINRAMAAKEMNQEVIFEVFFQRAYELGTVSKQDYRDYKLQKLGI